VGVLQEDGKLQTPEDVDSPQMGRGMSSGQDSEGRERLMLKIPSTFEGFLHVIHEQRAVAAAALLTPAGKHRPLETALNNARFALEEVKPPNSQDPESITKRPVLAVPANQVESRIDSKRRPSITGSALAGAPPSPIRAMQAVAGVSTSIIRALQASQVTKPTEVRAQSLFPLSVVPQILEQAGVDLQGQEERKAVEAELRALDMDPEGTGMVSAEIIRRAYSRAKEAQRRLEIRREAAFGRSCGFSTREVAKLRHEFRLACQQEESKSWYWKTE
ncbi:unnamed protein product, partial [Polarella glacialis]